MGASARGPAVAQLTAGYTVNTYSVIHSALARLAWRASYARGLYCRRCRASPGVPAEFSGLATLCRMPKTKLIGRPVPEIHPKLARTDRRTDTTYQPTGQQPFSQYPAVSWELAWSLGSQEPHNRQCSPRGTPLKFAWNMGAVALLRKHAISLSLKRGKIGQRLLLMTDRKSNIRAFDCDFLRSSAEHIFGSIATVFASNDVFRWGLIS